MKESPRRMGSGGQKSDISSLLRDFVEAVARHGELTERSADADLTNREYHRYDRARQALLKASKGRSALIGLLGHRNVWVRYVAASSCADFAPRAAERALVAISQEPGIIGFNARISLRKLRGELNSNVARHTDGDGHA